MMGECRSCQHRNKRTLTATVSSDLRVLWWSSGPAGVECPSVCASQVQDPPRLMNSRSERRPYHMLPTTNHWLPVTQLTLPIWKHWDFPVKLVQTQSAETLQRQQNKLSDVTHLLLWLTENDRHRFSSSLVLHQTDSSPPRPQPNWINAFGQPLHVNSGCCQSCWFLFSCIVDAWITRKISHHLGNEEWNANTR